MPACLKQGRPDAGGLQEALQLVEWVSADHKLYTVLMATESMTTQATLEEAALLICILFFKGKPLK